MALVVSQLVAKISVQGASQAKTDISSVSDSVNAAGKGFLSLAGGALVVAGAAIAGVGIASTKMAGDFQSSITTLKTGAGEFQSNLGMVSKGILDMAVQTGESTSQLTAGMFEVESAGFRGANALNILKNAAEGAKVGNADLDATAKAVTGVMLNYADVHLTAAQATNTLIATMQNGQVHMGDLAGAMAAVLPIAAKSGVSLTDVSAAMATMTAKTVPAADAATYLRQTIMAIENPSKAAASEMTAMGLKSSDVAAEMKVSLPGALQMITDAAGKKFPEGSAGYVAAISKMVGGTKSMQGIMNLTGSDMSAFKANVDHISSAVKSGGNAIIGWSDVQNDFNFRMDQAREVVETLGIKIGTALLPVVGKLLSNITPVITNFGNWVTNSHVLENAINTLTNAFKDISDKVSTTATFFEKNKTALDNLKIGAVALAGAIVGILTPGIIAATASFLALDVAALPWIALAGAIGAAVALIVVGFINLYNSSKPVRDTISGVGATFSFLIPIFNQIWHDISGLVVPAWQDLVNAFRDAMPEFKVVGEILAGLALVITGVVLAAVVAFVAGIVAASGGIIRIFTGIVQFIKGACDVLGGLFMALMDVLTGHTDEAIGHLRLAWQGVVLMLQGVGNAIAGIFMTLVGLVGGILVGFVRTIVGYFQGLYDTLIGHSIVPDMVNGIVSWFSQLPGRVGNWVQQMFNVVVNWFSQLPGKIAGFTDNIKNNISTAWNWIFTTISSKTGDIFNSIMKPFNQARDSIGGVVRAFINNSIGAFNNGLKGIENFVNFFGSAIDWVAGKLNAGSPIPHYAIPLIPSYAKGTDAHPGGPAIVGEKGPELVMLPKGASVLPNDKTSALLALLSGKKVPGYASGTGNPVGDFFSWLAGGAQSVLDNVLKMFNVSAPSLPGAMSSISSHIFDTVKTWALSFIDKLLPKFGGAGPDGTPVNIPGNVASWIAAGMGLKGTPASWANDLGIIAMHESGGNPNAINNWDSNALAGHPSQGLFQTIPSTFFAYALPGHTNILNPIDNTAAAIGYIMSRYGDVFHVPGIVSMASGGSYVGYANGVNRAPGGMAWVGERGPELMYVPRGASVIPNNRLGSSLQGDSSQTWQMHVYLDGKELADNIGNRIIKSGRGTGPIRKGL